MSSQQYLHRPLHEADGPLVWIDCEMTGRPFEYNSVLPHGSILHRDGLGSENLSILPSLASHGRVKCAASVSSAFYTEYLSEV